MKHLREMAKAANKSKIARYCGGDVSRVEKGMPSRDGAKGYATGGKVADGDMMMAGGMPAKGRLDRGGRKKPDAGKKGTNVNVIVMPKDGGGDKGAPMPPSDMPAPPMAGPPPPMPMPPPGAGPGGPPMRAKGGRVMKNMMADAKANKKVMTDDCEPEMRAKGGRAMMKNDDAKADKKMIDAEIRKHEKHDHKGQKPTKFGEGGPVLKGFKAGAGSGEGRLEKEKAYAKRRK